MCFLRGKALTLMMHILRWCISRLIRVIAEFKRTVGTLTEKGSTIDQAKSYADSRLCSLVIKSHGSDIRAG